ncbi:S1/P1 Nuclease [Pedobacter sp. SD-b]|uniref:S1/P1 Nuclease n=1 Tax=Pedobacter segetis TaxID=2793069 RepID=A0ABS1BPM2_9SPHI|nr:zinc dependent phospholipase C family protein [Pedobacter segetis]MBK0384416.1 S1/P1 Nuclease [Pedobacter segetis]
MKKALKKISIILFLSFTAGFAFAWGRWGHQYINHASILALPNPLKAFFYNHADFITEESVVPDIRKYTIGDKAEFPRHYIDLEDYGPDALQTLPKDYQSAYAKINKDSLSKKGSLPWTIEEMQDKLTAAFKQKSKNEILFIAATLGHYIGDANMPLHTSSNHNGKQTNQQGIHSLFEGEMLEMFGKTINLNTGPAPYFNDINKTTWEMIATSNACADTLLKADAALRKSFPKKNILLLDDADKPVKNQYGDLYFSDDYVKTLHKNLDGLLERRMRAAVYYTSGFWYTAWVNAGKPDLSMLDDGNITKKNQKSLKKELRLWQKGKLINLKPQPEFKLIKPIYTHD